MSKGEETRQRIIERAAPLFNQHGLDGVSISDIMAATNLQKGGIYRHFDSKEEIAVAAFDHSYRHLTRSVTDGINQLPTAKERLTTFLQNFAHIPSQLAGGCVVLNTAVENDDSGSALLRERARRAVEQWHETIVVILSKGIANGEFRPALDADATATLYIAALEGGIMLTQLHGDETHVMCVLDRLIEHVKDSVLTPGNE